jgi:outer membrane protein assembly factor BamB
MRWHRVLPLALTLALLVAPFTGHATAVDPAWVALSASGYDCDGSLATADDAGVLMWTKVLSDTERLDPELVRLDESTGLVDWTYRYVGPAHGQDAFVDVQPSASGAAVFVAGTEAWGKQTFETAIAQATGAPLWFHTAAGPYDTKQRRSAPVELAVSPDGSAVLEAGSSPSSDGDWDAYVSAYDPSSGAPLWSVRIDRSKDQARSIALSSDGATAYLSVATSRHLDRSLLVALDVTDGSTLWQTLSDRSAMSTLAVSANGATVYGLDRGVSATDTADGSPRWHTAGGKTVHGADLALGTGGDVFVTGAVGSGYTDAITMRLGGATGEVVWRAKYAGPAGFDDDGASVAMSPDGAVAYVVGSRDVLYSSGPMGDFDMIAQAYDASTGDRLWSDAYLADGGFEFGRAVTIAPDGGTVYACGSVTPDGYGEGTAVLAYPT